MQAIADMLLLRTCPIYQWSLANHALSILLISTTGGDRLAIHIFHVALADLYCLAPGHCGHRQGRPSTFWICDPRVISKFNELHAASTLQQIPQRGLEGTAGAADT